MIRKVKMTSQSRQLELPVMVDLNRMADSSAVQALFTGSLVTKDVTTTRFDPAEATSSDRSIYDAISENYLRARAR